jgi:hypothetical protein
MLGIAPKPELRLPGTPSILLRHSLTVTTGWTANATVIYPHPVHERRQRTAISLSAHSFIPLPPNNGNAVLFVYTSLYQCQPHRTGLFRAKLVVQ